MSIKLSMLEKLSPKNYLRNKLSLIPRYSYSPFQSSIHSRLLLEQLEPRILLSGVSYVVNTLVDVVAADGVVSLREAIDAANTNTAVNEAAAGSDAETDIITFDMAALQAEVGEGNPLRIILGGTQLSISDDLEIQGLGADTLTIDANGGSRVFYIDANAAVGIFGLKITGGYITDVYDGGGGGICSAGILTITDSQISGNSAGESGGGGIYNYSGMVTVSNSMISDNTAGGGGGIFKEFGTLTVTDSIIENNSGGSDGGGICGLGGTIYISNSTINNNSSGMGGGIYYDGTLTVDNSTINDNVADNFGGGICAGFHGGNATLAVTYSTICGNSSAFGGGICNGSPPIPGGGSSGPTTITNSIISGNSVVTDGYGFGGGGGIYGGEIRITSSVIADNSVVSWPYVNEWGYNYGGSSDGGGIMGEVVIVENSKIIGNSVYFYSEEYDRTEETVYSCNGGGIAGNSVTVIDSVVVCNSALLSGEMESSGGGISGNTIKVVNSTIAGNLAENGGGVSGTLTADNSIITMNDGGNATGSVTAHSSIIDIDPGFVQNPSVTVWDDGMGGTSCSYEEGDLHLAQNSFAVNAGNNTLAVDLHDDLLIADIEGNTRIYDGIVDVGAYEYQGVPAGTHILVVDTIADDVNYNDGLLTLREAIYYATNLSGINTITFDSSLNSQEIVLFGQELLIDSDITIDASSLTEGITINGDGKSRIFNIDGATVELINLTITNGYTLDDGGGIYNSGTLTVTDSTVNNCSVSWDVCRAGGGIYSSGTLVLSDSVVSDNKADSGCGIYSSGSLTVTGSTISSNLGGVGGGIYSDGTLLVENSTISDNYVGYGGGIYGGTITVIGSTIINNYADLYGGGIYGDAVTITDSTISGNTCRRAGGGILCSGVLTVTNSSIDDNRADFGGGIADAEYGGYLDTSCDSIITITDSLIGGNVANFGMGGGVVSCGILKITNSTIKDNLSGNYDCSLGGDYYEQTYGYGGGIYGNEVIVTNSSIIGNVAYSYNNVDNYSYGGGIYGGTVTVTNSIVTNNFAYFYDENAEYSCGGGIYGDTIKVINSTVVANYSGIGAGIYSRVVLTADNSIIALNGDNDIEGNIVSNNSIIGTDPLFVQTPWNNCRWGDWASMKPLYQEGDPHLKQNSVAVNFGNNALAVDYDGNALTVDFEGNGRINDGTVDAGAYECYAVTITYVVNTLSDIVANDGLISLREAIEAANTNSAVNEAGAGSNAGTDIIIFDLDALRTEAGESNPLRIILNGTQLYISDDLEIQGLGADVLTIDACGNSRVFYIGAGVIAGLSGLKITGGIANYGGGIYNGGILDIENSYITGNSAENDGGGLCNSGTLTIRNTITTANSADCGGGICSGGMYAESKPLILINSTVTNNSANNCGGIYSYDVLTANNSIISLNRGGDVCGDIVSNCSIVGIDPGFVRNPSIGEDGIWNTEDDDWGDLHLSQNSIAINCGDNAFAIGNDGNTLVNDAEGNLRIFDYIVDAGAYEYQDTPAAGRESPSSIVTTFSDVTNCYDGMITLREAIYYSQVLGTNIITFDESLSGGEIILSGYELLISSDITIDASNIENGITINGGGKSRVFGIAGATTEFINLIITGGSTDGDGGGINNTFGTLVVTDSIICDNMANNHKNSGGGISNFGGTLTITNSSVTGNTAVYGGGIYNGYSSITNILDSTISSNSANCGGGIYNTLSTLSVTTSVINGNFAKSDGGIYSYGGTLTLEGSTISNNSADWYSGGIRNESGTLSITNSTISGNSTEGTGGGIVSSAGTLMVTNSNVSGNSAGLDGGGIVSGATLEIVNSMINGNISGRDGGGIFCAGTLRLINSVIVGNTSSTDYYSGGGIYIYGNSGTFTLTNSTISGNFGGGINNNNATSPVIMNNSIVALNYEKDIEGKSIAKGSIVGINPGFVRNPSAGEDGAWNTEDDDFGDLHLSQDSIAINAGDNTRAVGLDGNTLATDMDGNPRIYDDVVDVGAYEYQNTPATGREAASLIVTTLSDVTNFYDGIITLREAIYYASRSSETNIITFETSLAGNEIVLAGEELFVNGDITIDATGLEGGITVNGNMQSRVFYIAATTVELKNLLITGGITYADGGGICNYGTLKVTESTISANSCGCSGGGIYNDGTLVITNSIICDNSASSSFGTYYNKYDISRTYCGGGIYNNRNGTLILSASVISNNSASHGAGIYNNHGVVMLTDSIISGNSAHWDSGGIRNEYGVLTITNSTISGNFAARYGAEIYSVGGTVTLTGSDIADGMVIDQNGDGVPDTVVDSETGETLLVINLSNEVTIASNQSPASQNDPEVELTVPKSDGWIYLSVADPFDGTRELLSITTSDGRVISPNNWWIDDSGNICILDDPDVVYELDYENPAEVIGRHIFYNNSSFDTTSDDAAIATDKQALLAGSKATFANYTSYTRGINGIMVDISGLAGSVTVDDFTFCIGNSDTVSSWTAAAIPASITVSTGEGESGSDRIVIIWSDGVIVNKWLEVTVLANENTGLVSDDVFYFGNAIGETGNSALNASVNISDIALSRVNQTGFTQAGITNLYDFNRDKKVNVTDIGLVRGHQSGFSPLRLIDLTVSEGMMMTADIIVESNSSPAVNPQAMLLKSSDSIWPTHDSDDEDSLLAILQIT